MRSSVSNWCRIFTRRMSFLSANQQCLALKGTYRKYGRGYFITNKLMMTKNSSVLFVSVRLCLNSTHTSVVHFLSQFHLQCCNREMCLKLIHWTSPQGNVVQPQPITAQGPAIPEVFCLATAVAVSWCRKKQDLFSMLPPWRISLHVPCCSEVNTTLSCVKRVHITCVCWYCVM